MSYLLDTHALLWAIGKSDELSDRIKQIIKNPSNGIFTSTVSLWEISIKYRMKKLDLDGLTPEKIPKYIEEIGFEIIELSKEE